MIEHGSNWKKKKIVSNSQLIPLLSIQLHLMQRTPELSGILLAWFSLCFSIIYILAIAVELMF